MVTARSHPDYFPYGVSVAVRNLEYAVDINIGQPYIAQYGALLALSTTFFASAVLSTTGVALSLTASAGTILNGGLVPGFSASRVSCWGRGLTVVGDGASTRTITINGFDYLGQRMQWTGAVNGTTPVPVAKAFLWVTDITFGAAADTVSVSVGYNNVLGVPYTLGSGLITEMKNGNVAANAGSVVNALADATAATATNADVRGTYTPATLIPDGTNTFEISYIPRRGNLHGNAQFSA